MKPLCYAIALSCCSVLFAQGDDNLLLQYRRGPNLDGFYHRWNATLSMQGHWINTDRDYTKAGISVGGGIGVQYNFSKSFGLETGIHWLPIHYSYTLENNGTRDRIRYWEVPLLGRLSPSRKWTFLFGPTYNRLQSAKNTAIVDVSNNSTVYPEGRFQNAFGALLGLNFQWKGYLAVGVRYRYIKKDSPLLQLQSNNFSGFSLGLFYTLKNPFTKPKEL